MSPSDSIPDRKKLPEPTTLPLPTDLSSLPTDFPEQNRKHTCQGTRIQTHHFQIHRQRNIICQMTPIQVNQIKINAIRSKSVKKTRKRTHQAHRREILIRPTTMITDRNYVRGRATGKYSYQIMRMFNGKVADNII